MSFIDRIEGPGETQDLPEIKKRSLSKSELLAGVINKIEELQDIKDSILVFDEAEKLLDDKWRTDAEKVNEMLAAEPMWKFIWMDEAPEHLIAKWTKNHPKGEDGYGKKLRHSRTRMEKTLARRKGRYSKE